MPLTARRLLCLCALALVCGAPGASAAAEKKADKTRAAPELSAAELKGVRELFGCLSAAFVSADVGACMRLFGAGLPERERIKARLEREFGQWRYVSFEAAEIWPDDKLDEKTHSVDVLLRYTLADRQIPSGQQEEISNSNTYTFVLQKQDDGSFALGRSQFFDTLGLRQGLGGITVAVLTAIALCAFLSFWVWMGYEALRARPRSHFWRIVVPCVPLLGASLYFVWVYLPRLITGAGLGSQEH